MCIYIGIGTLGEGGEGKIGGLLRNNMKLNTLTKEGGGGEPKLNEIKNKKRRKKGKREKRK